MTLKESALIVLLDAAHKSKGMSNLALQKGHCCDVEALTLFYSEYLTNAF